MRLSKEHPNGSDKLCLAISFLSQLHFQFVSLSQTKKKMLFFTLTNPQKDILLYAGLIVGAIVLVGLITKLIGYHDDHTGIDEEYEPFFNGDNDDNDFWIENE